MAIFVDVTEDECNIIIIYLKTKMCTGSVLNLGTIWQNVTELWRFIDLCQIVYLGGISQRWFLIDGQTELYQFWKVHREIIWTPSAHFRFQVCCSRSEWVRVNDDYCQKSRPNFARSPSVKCRGGWPNCVRHASKFSVGPTLWYTIFRPVFTRAILQCLILRERRPT